jgi:hypothetical protein
VRLGFPLDPDADAGKLVAVEREIQTTLSDAHYSSLEEAVKDAKSEIEIREK